MIRTVMIPGSNTTPATGAAGGAPQRLRRKRAAEPELRKTTTVHAQVGRIAVAVIAAAREDTVHAGSGTGCRARAGPPLVTAPLAAAIGVRVADQVLGSWAVAVARARWPADETLARGTAQPEILLAELGRRAVPIGDALIGRWRTAGQEASRAEAELSRDRAVRILPACPGWRRGESRGRRGGGRAGGCRARGVRGWSRVRARTLVASTGAEAQQEAGAERREEEPSHGLDPIA
jgi:hypothetical protein